MIRWFAFALAMIALSVGGLLSARAATYLLNDGTTVEGEPTTPTPDGILLKKPDGSYPRVRWTNFTQQALKDLAKQQPKAKTFIEPLLEDDESDAEKKPALIIKPKEHARLDRPDPKAGMGALFSSGLSLLLILLVYAGNIYAGFEIAIFRNYHPGLVCGIAAVAPVIGPAIFLCLPPRLQKSLDELAAESMSEHGGEVTQLSYVHPGSQEATPEAQAAAEKAAAESLVTVYQRGKTSFNRRFFETKFAGFLKVVPGDADKEIYVKSSRGEYVGHRLTRVQGNEIILQVQKGEATSDVIIPFPEIVEVQVRPRSA